MKKVPLLLRAIFVAAFVAEGAAFSQPARKLKPMSSGSPKPEDSTSKSIIVLPPDKAQSVRMPRLDKAPAIDGELDDGICDDDYAGILFDTVNRGSCRNQIPGRRVEQSGIEQALNFEFSASKPSHDSV